MDLTKLPKEKLKLIKNNKIQFDENYNYLKSVGFTHLDELLFTYFDLFIMPIGLLKENVKKIDIEKVNEDINNIYDYLI